MKYQRKKNSKSNNTNNWNYDDYFINADTTTLAFNDFKSVYVCPVPTKTIG